MRFCGSHNFFRASDEQAQTDVFTFDRTFAQLNLNLTIGSSLRDNPPRTATTAVGYAALTTATAKAVAIEAAGTGGAAAWQALIILTQQYMRAGRANR